MKQPELYERFKALHERPNGFVMPNAWDGVSAALLKEAGFEALGTSSAAIASALGRLDGRHTITREEHIENAKLLNRLSGLPINGDFEDGYGDSPKDVAATVEASIAAGLAGIGIEDTSGNPDKPIRDFDDAVARVREAAKVAKGRILLTGRTDNYLHGRPDLEDSIKRLVAFAEVGADVLYAPYPQGYGPRRETGEGRRTEAVEPGRRHDDDHPSRRRRAEGRREAHQHRCRILPAGHG